MFYHPPFRVMIVVVASSSLGPFYDIVNWQGQSFLCMASLAAAFNCALLDDTCIGCCHITLLNYISLFLLVVGITGRVSCWLRNRDMFFRVLFLVDVKQLIQALDTECLQPPFWLCQQRPWLIPTAGVEHGIRMRISVQQCPIRR